MKYERISSTCSQLAFVSDKLWMQQTYIHIQNKSLRNQLHW